MAVLHTSTAPLPGGNSVRVRLLDLVGEKRVDVRRFDYTTPSAYGVCVDVRHLQAIRAAFEEAEREAERLGLLTEQDQ